MVEDVRRLAAQLESVAFAELQVLRQRQAPAFVARSPDDAAAFIAGQMRAHRRRGQAGGVEPLVASLRTTIRIASQVGTQAGSAGADDAQSRGVRSRGRRSVGQAGIVVGDSRSFPTA